STSPALPRMIERRIEAGPCGPRQSRGSTVQSTRSIPAPATDRSTAFDQLPPGAPNSPGGPPHARRTAPCAPPIAPATPTARPAPRPQPRRGDRPRHGLCPAPRGCPDQPGEPARRLQDGLLRLADLRIDQDGRQRREMAGVAHGVVPERVARLGDAPDEPRVL